MNTADNQLFGQRFVAGRMERRLTALEAALAALDPKSPTGPARIRAATQEIAQTRARITHIARTIRTTEIAHAQGKADPATGSPESYVPPKVGPGASS